MREILRFQPLYQERVWGGRAFESAFERKLPSEQPIGESWEMVDRPEAQSVVHGGTETILYYHQSEKCLSTLEAPLLVL